MFLSHVGAEGVDTDVKVVNGEGGMGLSEHSAKVTALKICPEAVPVHVRIRTRRRSVSGPGQAERENCEIDGRILGLETGQEVMKRTVLGVYRVRGLRES